MMRRVIVTIVAVATALTATPVQADWVALDGKAPEGKPALKASGAVDRFTVDLEIPGIEVTSEEGYVAVRIPGQSRLMDKGTPELPLVSTSVILPDRGHPEVKLVAVEEVTIPVKGKVAPSRGHLDRNTPLSTIPLVEGDVYKQDAWYPAKHFTTQVDSPFIVRDFRGTAIRIAPVLYNPVTSQLRVLKKARLEVTVTLNRTGKNEKRRGRAGLDSEFAPLYRSLFVNYSAGAMIAGEINENAGRALIITPDAWVTNLQPLVDWRKTKGLDTKVVLASEITGAVETNPTADQLKTFIQGEYDKGGLTYVHLIGDGDKMPPLKGVKERADSDACLVKCEGDDHIPDLFISRFSANTPAEVDVQVARTVAYEKAPITGDAAAFYHRGTGIASNEGNPTDFTRCEWLRTALEAYGFDKHDKVYDPGANPTQVLEAVNEGRGHINYIGHGSKTMWVTSRFGNNHIPQLTNTDGKWPMIWSVACVNGDFVRGTDCFGEAWAKAGTAEAPKGSIGMIAASTNMSWVPPCDWQNAIVTQYMTKEVIWTGGALHYYGLLKACEQWGTTATSEGVRLIEQCIYFGDASVQQRTSKPRTASVALADSASRSLGVKVTVGDKAIKGARVVVKGSGDPVVGVTGEDGLASVPFVNGPEPVKDVKVTVTGPNLVPVIESTLTLPDAPVPPTEPAPPGDGDGGSDGE